MATKKITLNELRSLVKQVIKEESDDVRKKRFDFTQSPWNSKIGYDGKGNIISSFEAENGAKIQFIEENDNYAIYVNGRGLFASESIQKIRDAYFEEILKYK